MSFELGTDGPKVIVVGVDGSDTSMRAGAYAAGLARRQRARLVVVYVTGVPAASRLVAEAAGAVEQAVAEATEDMRRQVELGALHAGVNAEFVAVRGDPYQELVRVAAELRADAVVVGSSRRFGHRFVGSLAVRLVKAGRWPVTVVP
ncbi:universal stress protein [Dactylosporangium sp. AC04546]|uniref:universal stress protein n=1 Tax=Dactylosporangium sp. AC04546 TaxID=2862460 RepID=UPI001EDE6278|nr:universal stress protein [Dactylosporangium sp. AC04546]WVK79766.1 universal stress protein [Dactylosporangium sp. AC04546]